MIATEPLIKTGALATSNGEPSFSSTMTRIINRLACPQCHSGLSHTGPHLRCSVCQELYSVVGDVADLRPVTTEKKQEAVDWTDHWSEERQHSMSQRFFSVYRKSIFARTVRHFVDTYLPTAGVLVEAGCGTSETSMRISKHNGERTLVAVDIVLPVLAKCHPVMDVRLCADIFRLPFRDNSLDGIWNVGVMEHFLHEQIDNILREFHRVLKPDARLILLWPATSSVPQRMLRVAERIIHATSKQKDFRFHPDEISQLRSGQEGRDVLRRNGFQTIHVDEGWRSLMAFKTLVGAKS